VDNNKARNTFYLFIFFQNFWLNFTGKKSPLSVVISVAIDIEVTSFAGTAKFEPVVKSLQWSFLLFCDTLYGNGFSDKNKFRGGA